MVARVALLLALLSVGSPVLVWAGEAFSVVAYVRFCKVEAPLECREVEVVPQRGEAASVVECMRGVSMAAAEFTYEGERWFTKGGTCKEVPNDYLAWKAERSR